MSLWMLRLATEMGLAKRLQILIQRGFIKKIPSAFSTKKPSRKPKVIA
jgi:hypothetical protein